MKVISVKCPDCGATLEIEEGRKQAFCTYCGAKVLLENENEYIYRHIDEAEMKQAETDQMVRMRQMAMAEKKQAEDRKILSLKIKISLALLFVGIIMMVVGYMGGHASGDPDSGLYMLSLMGFFPLMGAAYIWIFSKKDEDKERYDGKIRVPSGARDFEKKNYASVEAAFRGAGFTNVTSIPLNDLSMGLLKKPGMVASITINGKETTSGRYFPDASVVISYHSMSR